MMRIAHFSDIHMSAPAATLTRLWQGKRLLGGMNMLLFRRRELQNRRFPMLLEHLAQQQVDHLIVSGDLSTTSLNAEFRLAHNVLQPWIDEKNITTIPGNHDVYTPNDVKRRRYEKYFAQCHGYSSTATGYPFVKELDQDIVLIGLNSCVPTDLLGAWGIVGEPQRQQTEQLLQQYEGRFRIVVLHHFLEDRRGGDGLPKRGLRDRESLLESLQRAGCEMILHGHEHARYTYTVPGPSGPIPVYNPGPSNSMSRKRHHPGGYLIYTIEGQELERIEEFELSFPNGDICPGNILPAPMP